MYFCNMFENKNSRTELNQLGEFGLIQYIKDNVTLSQPGSLTGIGDDAAVIDNGPGRTVITTDMLLEGVHFDLAYCPLKHLGYKSVVVNVSDLCAMNATPRQIVIGLGLSNRFSLDAIEEFYAGVLLACERYGVDLVGGDTTSSKSGMVISITAIGSAPEEDLVYRNGAKENDLICVTGDLGAAYMGLTVLQREKQVFLNAPDASIKLEGDDYIIGRQLKPEARKDVVEYFAAQNIMPTSMMDISDGLSSELMHICKQSNVGCVIYEDKLPLNEESKAFAYKLELDPTACALSGGEDYELLFTVAQADYEKINANNGLSIIGYVTGKNEGQHIITRGGNKHALVAQGWNHLNK